MVVNRERRVFVGKRIDTRESRWWQMPQGGVDPGEDLEQAALRELEEETGIGGQLVSILARTRSPIRYDLPEDLIGKLWEGKYRGQEQFWFLARFDGRDDEIDLNAHDTPEFCEWKWVKPSQLPRIIIPFKREVYQTVLDEFEALI